MVAPLSVHVVFGGSSGLGAACVRRLAADDARGIVADTQSPGESLHSDMGDRFRFLHTDVTSEESVRNALTQAGDAFGPVRSAVVTAGVIHAERIVGRNRPFDLEAFRRVVDVNLVGTFNVLRLAAETMRNNSEDEQGQRGVIITTASVAAYEGQIGQAAYSASKGGVAALTVPASRELGPLGIRVVCIAPGVFETPMMQQVSKTYRESLAAQTPFPHRFGRPEEFGALVGHVLENHMLNGCVIRLDGGIRMAAQ